MNVTEMLIRFAAGCAFCLPGIAMLHLSFAAVEDFSSAVRRTGRLLDEDSLTSLALTFAFFAIGLLSTLGGAYAITGTW